MSDTENLILRSVERPQGSFETTVKPCVAECVGVCLFVFVGCLALSSGDLAGAAIGHGFMIALLIMGLGEVRYVLCFSIPY